MASLESKMRAEMLQSGNTDELSQTTQVWKEKKPHWPLPILVHVLGLLLWE